MSYLGQHSIHTIANIKFSRFEVKRKSWKYMFSMKVLEIALVKILVSVVSSVYFMHCRLLSRREKLVQCISTVSTENYILNSLSSGYKREKSIKYRAQVNCISSMLTAPKNYSQAKFNYIKVINFQMLLLDTTKKDTNI